MAYYLKKTKLKGRTYLSIAESFYSHEKRGTAHKCLRSLGSVETWIEKGVPDPISHFQKEVDALNQEKANAGVRKRKNLGFAGERLHGRERQEREAVIPV